MIAIRIKSRFIYQTTLGGANSNFISFYLQIIQGRICLFSNGSSALRIEVPTHFSHYRNQRVLKYQGSYPADISMF